jgi:hypothetical protein
LHQNLFHGGQSGVRGRLAIGNHHQVKAGPFHQVSRREEYGALTLSRTEQVFLSSSKIVARERGGIVKLVCWTMMIANRDASDRNRPAKAAGPKVGRRTCLKRFANALKNHSLSFPRFVSRDGTVFSVDPDFRLNITPLGDEAIMSAEGVQVLR